MQSRGTIHELKRRQFLANAHTVRSLNYSGLHLNTDKAYHKIFRIQNYNLFRTFSSKSQVKAFESTFRGQEILFLQV